MLKNTHSNIRRGGDRPEFNGSNSFGLRFLILVACHSLLQARLPAATFTVTTINDNGPGSLRQAILDANAAGDLDTVRFQIPGTAPFTISPSSPLPVLAAPVFIDGSTQPGYAGSPIVELNGSAAGPGAVGVLA